MSIVKSETDLHPSSARAAARAGVVCGASAHLLWGFLPLYFKLIAEVPSIQILAHRIIWSLLFILIITTIRSTWDELKSVLRDRRAMLMLCASTLLLSTNWFVFIHAVNTGHTVEASLGYFINPLFTVCLGLIFLGERMRLGQAIGIFLALIGVIILTWSHGTIPWIAMSLAATFGCYSLLRKTVRAGSMSGLTVETALLFIPAMIAIGMYHREGHRYTAHTWLLLPLAGVVTAIPYLLFAAAARRLRLMTMGFLQYLTPTCHFLLAIFAFHEPLARKDLISFTLIWIALAIYSWDSYRAFWRARTIEAQAMRIGKP